MWVRRKEFVHVLHFTELSSSSLLNHIASPGYLPCGFCVTSPVRHFDQQRSWWSYNDSTTLTYLVFPLTTNQTKQFNPFLVETATCEFTIAALHHYSCFASMTLPYCIHFIKCALEFGKVKIKLLEMTFKGNQSIFPHQQPLHCLVLTFRSNYEAYCHSISTRAIDLNVDSARITGSCASSHVTLVVPVDLHNLCVRSSECKHVMACICVG